MHFFFTFMENLFMVHPILGHSLAPLARSLAPLPHKLAPHCSLRSRDPLRAFIRSLARSLTRSRVHGKELHVFEMNASISYRYNPLCAVDTFFQRVESLFQGGRRKIFWVALSFCLSTVDRFLNESIPLTLYNFPIVF